MLETGLVTGLMEALATLGPVAIVIGTLVVIIIKQQEKSIERIEKQQEEMVETIMNQNGVIVDHLQEDKNNYYQIVQDQGTLLREHGEILKELKTIVQRQEFNQEKIEKHLNDHTLKLEKMETKVDYLDKKLDN